MNIIVFSADLPTYFDNVQLYSLETCLRIFTKPNLPELRLLVVGLRGSGMELMTDRATELGTGD